MNNKPSVLIIVGPTAVGKTKLAIELAKSLNGEIISADSMQIYKYMNIGTAKPTIEEMDGIKHHLIDEIDPKIEFSVAQYKELCEKYINEVISRNKLPIVVGGTGLYINSLIYNIQFADIQADEKYRKELCEIAKEKGNEYLHEMLKDIDEVSYKKLHPNDIKRVIRALEVYKVTNKPISYHQSISRLKDADYNFIIIGLDMDRELLYKRINDRVEEMFRKGLIDEVKDLLKMGYNKNMISMQGIGYKEIINYIDGFTSIEEAIDIIKRESRRYAKRQLTWFRNNKNIKWFNLNNESIEKFLKKLNEYIAQKMVIM